MAAVRPAGEFRAPNWIWVKGRLMGRSSSRVRARSTGFVRRLIILLTVAIEFGWIASAASAAGFPLYPDLVTLPPSGLYIERAADGRYLLRFANTAGNLGGRLEIAVGAGTRDLYQNVYDQYTGGSRVIHQRVGSDLIYHPAHNHFHFEGFAKYELLKRDSAGYYRTTTRKGSKTTFCILDTVRISTIGPTGQTYGGCGATVQGMSAGWADVYIASLSGQWIDLGATPLPDGAYAIRSVADPDTRLMELNDFNNANQTYFRVLNGRIATDSAPPLCSVETLSMSATSSGSQASATVGSSVALNCLRFGSHEQVDIYWGSVNTTPRQTVTSTEGGGVSARVTVPNASLGVHYVIARGRDSGTQAAAVVNVLPALSTSPRRTVVGAQVSVTLTGFSASETVEVRLFKTNESWIAAGSVKVSSTGKGTLTFAVPAVPYGGHRITGTGQDSGVIARGSITVTPTVDAVPEEVEPGGTIGVSLRGFVAGEPVRVSIDGELLGKVVASHSGSASSRTTLLTIPGDLAPGAYQITAIGGLSARPVTTLITVVAPEPAEEPPPTASPEPSPSATPEGSPTAEPTATAPPANASPVAVAPVDLTQVDTDGNGVELVRLDGSASTDPDGDALTWRWSQMGTNELGEPVELVLSTDQIAEITLSAGEYTITLTVADPSGASHADDVRVRVEIPPPELVATPAT
jgi:hypothetical protein